MAARRGAPYTPRSLTVAAVAALVLSISGVGGLPGAPAPPAAALGAPSVAAGMIHTCGVQSDGTLACWGADVVGMATPPSGTFSAVSSGFYFSCGLRTNGTVTCWGSNYQGQANTPSGTFTAVSAGGYHACALAVDGSVACWGDNYDGEASPPSGTFTAVSAGGYHSCGLQVGGTVVCWGRNDSGQGSPPASSFTAISAGDYLTCGIEVGGTLACWGNNIVGGASPPAGTFSAVSAGRYYNNINFACGLRSDATLACWGNNVAGQSSPPTGSFTAVSAGGFHACGLRTGGTVTCWGQNVYGQANPRITTPVPPGGTLGVPYLYAMGTTYESPAAGYTVTAGSLPPGLLLSGNGVLSGTPTATGTFGAITVSATNGLAPVATQAFSIAIAPDASLTALASSPQPAVVGQAVSYTATVTPGHSANGQPTGTAAFFEDGSATPLPACSAQPLDSSGRAVCSVAYHAAGNHAVSATYSGSNDFQASSGSLAGGQTVDPAGTGVTVDAHPNPAVAGQEVTLAATVTVHPPGSGTPAGTVRFVVDGADSGGPVAVSDGQATTTIRPPAGPHTLSAVYSGTVDYQGDTSPAVTLPVDRSATTVDFTAPSQAVDAGRPVILTATVATVPPGSGVPTGAVQLVVDGAPVGDPLPLADGRATIRRRFPGGHHTVAIRYPGDANFTASASPARDLTARILSGYWLVGSDGAVYALGDAVGRGDARAALGQGVGAVDLEPAPSGEGYWIVDDHGQVHPLGDAPALGSAGPGTFAPGEKAVSLTSTDSGAGYWIFTSRGRVLAFGDAPVLGDMASRPLNSPILNGVATPSRRGYYLLAADGGVFTFGDATFAGSLVGQPLNAPLVSMAPDPDGRGYWLATADGGVFALDAPFRGSMTGTRLNGPITGITPYGDGYLLVGTDGGVFTFSTLPFRGSLGDHPPGRPVAGAAGI